MLRPTPTSSKVPAMANAIDFYFDFSSPSGYLASTQIDALAARHGRKAS